MPATALKFTWPAFQEALAFVAAKAFAGSGRPYDYDKKVMEHQTTFSEKMRALAERMRSGDLSHNDWIHESRLLISGHAMDGVVLGAAKAQGATPNKVRLTQADRRAIISQTTEQVRYFNKFATTVMAAKAAGADLTSQVDARAALYGGAVRSAYNYTWLADTEPLLPLRWTRHVMDSCPTCIRNEGQIASAAEWQARDVWPAHNTICRSNCKCTLSPVPAEELTQAVEPLQFHLPGKHNQKAHGGKGTELSPPDKGRTERALAVHKFLRQGLPNTSNYEEIRRAAKAEIARALAGRLINDPIARDYIAGGKLSAEDSRIIPMKTGDPQKDVELQMREIVRRRISRWSSTAGDSEPRSLALQLAVKEEFGLSDAAPFIRVQEVTLAATQDLHRKEGAFNRRLVRHMYEHTQEELAKAGIKEVTLHRGMGFDPRSQKVPKEFEHLVEVPSSFDFARTHTGLAALPKDQPMNSWSATSRVAKSFAEGEPIGVVVSAKVPASRILGSARTGFGCLPEDEFVVLSTPGKVQSTVRTWR